MYVSGTRATDAYSRQVSDSGVNTIGRSFTVRILLTWSAIVYKSELS